jgi:superfamily II DNA or RNA helicase
MNLLDYQVSHAENIKNSITKYSRAIDASDTGTGKTYVSIYVCQKLNLTPFIICPKSVKNTWTTLLEKSGFKNSEYFVTNYENIRVNKKYIIYDKVKDEYKWKPETFNKINNKEYIFIYDEAHRCKNINSINSKILLSLSDNDVKILMLSATLTDKIEYFIPFGKVLKFYKTLSDGLEWMSKNNNSPILINKKILKILQIFLKTMKLFVIVFMLINILK